MIANLKWTKFGNFRRGSKIGRFWVWPKTGNSDRSIVERCWSHSREREFKTLHLDNKLQLRAMRLHEDLVETGNLTFLSVHV